jgi:hypothetical protein
MKVNGPKVCHLALAALLAVLPVVSAPQALAGPLPCNDRKALADLLHRKYQEVPVSGGPEMSGSYVELFRSLPTSPRDTWSIILHSPSGRSCMLAAGEGWRETPVKVPAGDGI